MAAHKKAPSAATVTAPAVAVVPTEALAAAPAAGEADAAAQGVVMTGNTADESRPLAELVVAELKASELAAVDPVVADPVSVRPEFEFPVEVTLSNNGGFAIAEPVSGAFLQAGGSQTVWLHDAAHASRVYDNLCALAKRHHLAGALLVNGRPLETD